MKKIYWRPQRISLRLLWVIACVAVLGLIAVENYTVKEKQSYFATKLKAAKLAAKAFEAIHAKRIEMGLPIDIEADPAQTGLIGALLSPVTTNPGHLQSKQTTANPNFAAVMVHLLKRAGVKEGDKVAVGISGSFPAINISVLSALSVLNADPIIISSAGSSQWGANYPEFMWPEMEKLLVERHIFSFKSVAISRGGIDDRALGLSKKGRKILDNIIEHSGATPLVVKNYADSVEKRMALYDEYSGDARITAYVNVGGGTTSVGTKLGKKMFKPGLNRSIPRGGLHIDSVMTRFSMEGVPIIHMTSMNRLAERYGLPLQPALVPKPGEGRIFYKEVHSSILAASVLAIIIIMMIAFIRLDWGYRFISSNRKSHAPSNPERMV